MADVRVERTEDGFQATNDRGARVAIGDGDAPEVFTPVELLLAALGGCELVTVEPLTAQRGHRMVRLAATVEAEKIATSKLGTITITYDVELPSGAAGRSQGGETQRDEKAADVLTKVAKRVHDSYCTVGNALKEPMKVEQVVPVD